MCLVDKDWRSVSTGHRPGTDARDWSEAKPDSISPIHRSRRATSATSGTPSLSPWRLSRTRSSPAWSWRRSTGRSNVASSCTSCCRRATAERWRRTSASRWAPASTRACPVTRSWSRRISRGKRRRGGARGGHLECTGDQGPGPFVLHVFHAQTRELRNFGVSVDAPIALDLDFIDRGLFFISDENARSCATSTRTAASRTGSPIRRRASCGSMTTARWWRTRVRRTPTATASGTRATTAPRSRTRSRKTRMATV
jgi:hypothetical protein